MQSENPLIADLVKLANSAAGTFAGTFWEKPTINSFESGLELFKPTIAAINGPCLGYGVTVFESAPELWVHSDDDAARAGAVIREAFRLDSAGSAGAWRCAACGESNEDQFGACWRCGAADPRS